MVSKSSQVEGRLKVPGQHRPLGAKGLKPKY